LTILNTPPKGTSLTNDVFAHFMQICRDSYGADTEFVQAAEAAPEPMCIHISNN